MAVKAIDVPVEQLSIPDEAKIFGPWPKGMDNKLDDTSLPKELLRNAVNVDVDNTGRVRTRKGLAKVESCVSGRDAFGCPVGLLFVDESIQKCLTASGIVEVRRGVKSPIAYEYALGKAYCTDGVSCWTVGLSGTATAWGDPLPSVDVDFITSDFDTYPDLYVPVRPGRLLAYHFGRMYIVDAIEPNVVWFTEPYALGRVKLQKGFLQFASEVRVFAPVSDGIWCATAEETWWLDGTDPSEFADKIMTANPTLNYGGVFGTGVKVPNDNDVMWMSQRGAIRASPGGKLKNLQEANVAVSYSSAGAAIFKEQDGIRSYVATIIPDQPSPLVSETWAASETERKL